MSDIDKLFFNFRKWRTEGLKDEDGVVIASDQELEWLIPWWWENYRRFNTHPVVFVDYGMSEEMRSWCQERGDVIDLFVPDVFSAGNSLLNLLILDNNIEGLEEGFWSHRNAWLKKPLACLQSPFKRSIWIDLDCEVRGCIAGLFELDRESFSVVKDELPNQTWQLYPIYNSGVIVFEQGISVFEEWADLAIEQNHAFLGDQDILSWIIQQKALIVEMPEIYNWSRILEKNPQAVIVHWHGSEGKKCIQQMLFSHLS